MSEAATTARTLRRNGTRTAVLVWVAAMTVASLVACSDPPACTVIGAASGVSVTLDPELVTAAATTGTLRACVDDVCGGTSQIDDSSIFVGLSPVKNGTASVTLEITTSTGTLFAGKAKAHSIKSQPNGPGCPPTGWYVHVTAHAGGRLTS